MFASAVLANDKHFADSEMSTTQPEIHPKDLKATDLFPSPDDYPLLRNDFTKLLIIIAVDLIPHFSSFQDVCPKNLLPEGSRTFTTKTNVLPIGVRDLNENKKQDVPTILREYQDCFVNLFTACGIEMPEDAHIHIGGDQLTREKFSNALKLMLGNPYKEENLSRLYPVTFEFFHLMMNFLQAIFDVLHLESDKLQPGTLGFAKTRLDRRKVREPVKQQYDPCKEFITTTTRATAVAAILNHFGMDDISSPATKNIPPDFSSTDKKTEWIYKCFGNIVDLYIFPLYSKLYQPEPAEPVSAEELTNGERHEVLQSVKDKLKNYSHNHLELGMMFVYLRYCIKTPDYDQFMRALRFLLVIWKAAKPSAKYPYEIMRLMIQLKSLLPVAEAHQVFHDMFVNTKGHSDSHVPADQAQWAETCLNGI
jgi:hypothetical protein